MIRLRTDCFATGAGACCDHWSRNQLRRLALLGDRVQTGCNSVTSPGTILGKETFVFPCVSVRAGVYPSGSRLRG